jgi:hypothetical protein
MNYLEEFIKNFEPEIKNKPAFRFQLDKVILEIKQKAESSAQPITMRDYFAGQVIINNAFSLTTNLHDVETAKRAYEIADSMMKARENDS